jgi:hypothetical protein
MDPMLLRMFQRQLELQCRFLLLAADDLNRGLKVQDFTRIFFALQNLLGTAANISKALWGVKNKKPKFDRKALRDSIGITDESPLNDATMRNNFEHFDERLEKWWESSKDHNTIDLSVVPRSAISGIEPINWFRNYDPTTTDVTFWSEDFNLQALVNEVKRILPKLQEEAAKPHWEP